MAYLIHLIVTLFFTSALASSGSPLNVSLRYPTFPDGSFHSALRPGDRFRVYAHPNDPTMTNLVVDLSALGLSTQAFLYNDGGTYHSDEFTLPEQNSTTRTYISVSGTNVVQEVSTETLPVVIDNEIPTGTLEVTFTPPSASGDAWLAHITATYDGTGTTAIITDVALVGYDSEEHELGEVEISALQLQTLSSPLTTTVTVPNPDPSWESLSLRMSLIDEAGNKATISSHPFPRIIQNPVLINHALSGSIVEASNFSSQITPQGIGIPYSYLRTLPQGTYAAVVFFSDLQGCPTDNYEINAFIPNNIWGVGITGPAGAYSKAYASQGGGCMQQFRIDPTLGDSWLWGALSNTGTSSAIADINHIPAFAICATEEACDPITPVADIGTNHPSTTTKLVSNVMFLPGIKGSRLYRAFCSLSATLCEEPVWLPYTDLTAPHMYLDAEGKSLERLYTKRDGVLNHAYGYQLYDSFNEHMSSFSLSHPSWRWEAVPYDWRLSLPDLVHNGSLEEEKIYFEDAAPLPYLKDRLRSLASTSASGKVTIVAHSNGGLVAKALMQSLGNAQTSALIDSVIFVGVPQTGAPRAIAALLFGEGESLPGTGIFPELLLSKEHAREFARNAPMAYHLLPSLLYAADVFDPLHPLISLGDGVILAQARKLFGSQITTLASLYSYLSGDDGRAFPDPRDLRDPSIAQRDLLSYAQEEHALLDAWVPPSGVNVYQLAGWGIDTISGIELYEQTYKTLRGAATRLAYRPQLIEDGDGTVPIPSGLAMNDSESVHRYWINLPLISKNRTFGHANLFESPDIESFIISVLEGSPHISEVIAQSQPPTEHPLKKLLFVLHDPAELSITQNDSGEFIKIATDGAVSQTLFYAHADSFGEDAYVTVPAGNTYSVAITKPAGDSITLDVEEIREDKIIATSTVSIGATPRTSVAFEITSGIDDASAVAVDYDGNARTDATAVFTYSSTTFPTNELSTSQPVARAAIIPLPDKDDIVQTAEKDEEPVPQYNMKTFKTTSLSQNVKPAVDERREITTARSEKPEAKVTLAQRLLRWLRELLNKLRAH